MPKITMIGAGSVVFTRNLCNDILLTPALHESRIVLMDIDPIRLAKAHNLVQAMISQRGLRLQVESTTDQREAVQGADYVITTFQQGGLDAYNQDIEIPRQYGVEQCVGDTLGPGSILRALRTIPVMVNLCHDIDEVAPSALILNYVNPMAATCWAVNAITGMSLVGLCHSIQDTSAMLAEWIGVPLDEVIFLCAGVNHNSFFLKFLRNKSGGREDLYPRIWQAIERPEIRGRDPVRIELMENFGYFPTESSGHHSEYVPYFRKNAQMVEQDLFPRFKDEKSSSWFDFGRTGGYLRHCIARQRRSEQEYEGLLAGVGILPNKRSNEYGAYIIEAIETNQPIRIHGNVPNCGNINNLPDGCCVEVPCLVDGNGIQPTIVGSLPSQLAALCRNHVNVHSLIVDAALYGHRDSVYQAAMMDPLTAAVCTLPQIRSMMQQMLEAEARWLPPLR